MGAATVATVSLSASAVSFLDTLSGASSASMSIAVSSTGTATANISAITVGGADATSFSQTSNRGLTLASGSNCTVNVTFRPTAGNRTFNATLSVASNDAHSPATATLTGKGLAAGALSLSPTTQTFPSTTVGATSATLVSTIRNTTTNTIYLSAGSLTDATDFTQSDNCNGLLAAGGSCTVSFVFATKSTGAFTATYAIHDLNNPGAPLTVALSGTATAAPAPQAALTPTVSFGTVQIGSSGTQTLTFSNAGTAALTITSNAVTGGAAQFLVAISTCSSTLAANASCAFIVTFAPNANGTQTGTFSVTDAVGTGSPCGADSGDCELQQPHGR